VLVSFGGKIGYDARLDVALNQVFGPAAAPLATPAANPAPAAGTAPVPGELRGAVSDLDNALSRLRATEQSGDFAGEGNALADLDKAIKRFQTANTPPPDH
jgi:uncharacterized membrane protein (UPF0182 family)